MFTLNAALVLSVLCVSVAIAEDAPQLGERLNAAQLAAVDYTILPDGDGLPPGSGDAATGEVIYNVQCIACHGERGSDGINDRLVGGLGSIDSARPVKTVGSYWPYATTLFDYIRRAMPFQTPGSLSPDETYAVTAYVLYLNEIVEKDEALKASSLPDVRMPNRDNFTWAVSQD